MSQTRLGPLPPDYRQRVYAGWLGKCIGVRFGAPLEGWTYQEILDTLGELEWYLPSSDSGFGGWGATDGKIFKPDDDTAFPMILIRALQDYGPQVSAAQIGQTWLNYLGDQHGSLWWGGYGVSTEHTAYLNLKAGLFAPLSGSAALNGLGIAEQIGGQIFSDIWGLVAPNNPALAADYAEKASSVSHDGNGIYGGRFIAALVSAAFGERDPQGLIRAGLQVIPAGSEYARLVGAVQEFHRQHPTGWREAFNFLNENFGYQHYPGTVHIIPNAGVIVLALLYGGGDFTRSIRIANMAGWDTDCNVGNVGAILGVANGLEGIDPRWREPMNDTLVTASLIGAANLWDLPACAHLIADMGARIAGETPPPRPRYAFDLPGATHGFRFTGARGQVTVLRQARLDQRSALQAVIRKLNKKGEVRLGVETYLRPERLSANYYGASFSPKIFPGQRLQAELYLPEDASAHLRAGLYVWDDNRRQPLQGRAVGLEPGKWTRLSWEIPEMDGALLSQVGIFVRNLGGPWSGSLYLANLDWKGTPRFRYDFDRERLEYGAASQWTYLRGFWRLEDGAYHGSGPEINESYSGAPDWQDYTLSARMTPLLGTAHNILARVQGAQRCYALGLGPDGQLVLYNNAAGFAISNAAGFATGNASGYCPLASAPFAWEQGQSYTLNLKVEGPALTGWVEGGPRLEWIDEERPYLSGQIGLGNFGGCHTRYDWVGVS